jgi:glycosyltransferase involved in cell wall biosynthesis
MESDSTHRLFIDLSSFNPEYLGGVSRFAISLTDKLVQVNSIFNISIIPNQNNFNYLSSRYGKGFILTTYPKQLSGILSFIEKLNYNFFNSVRLFSAIQKNRYRKVLKTVAACEGVLYCPTTYLNFKSDKLLNVVSLHDIQEKKYPENFSKDQRIYRDIRVKYTLKNVSRVQVSSRFMANELEAAYNAKSSLLSEISEGVNLQLFRSSRVRMKLVGTPPKQFTIYVTGRFLAHKNHIEFFEAIDNFRAIPDLVVVVADIPENLPSEIRKILSRNPGLVMKLTGNLTDQELVDLYSEANLVLVPSLYESSSLPILEAIACGTSVLASSIPPHLEMASNLPVLIYESGNRLSLQQSLVDIMDGLFPLNQTDGNSDLTKYDWENITKVYLEMFKSLIQESGHS